MYVSDCICEKGATSACWLGRLLVRVLQLLALMAWLLGCCQVLNCLSDNMERIQAEGCLKEVSFLVWMEVQDFRADMQLAEACRSDVMRLCAKVEPGEGRVHQCLRANVKQLSSACRSAALL